MSFDVRTALFAACLAMLCLPIVVHGDEGMWLFNNVPAEHLAKKYDFKVTKEWLEHLQKSSVRFNSGGSGSFVSADGLVMTNHHVGADALQKLGTAKKDYVRDGFHAKTRQEEYKCEAMELNVLMDIIDVTKEVNKAVVDRRRREGRRRPAGGHRQHREERQGGAQAQAPGRHPLPGRGLPPLPVQEIHRRPPRLRAGAADRLLRRRSGQFRVPALRPRHLPVPRLRERQAGQAQALPQVGQEGRQGRRADLRLRTPRPDQSPEHRGRAGLPARHGFPVPDAAAVPPGRAAVHV